MKVLLSIPIMSYIFYKPPVLEDLGLGYLAAALREDGHTVLLRSWNMELSPEAYREFLERERPEAVGLKVFTKDVEAAVKTIDLIKSVNPGITVFVGGPHPSSCSSSDIFLDLPGADFAIKGEGEIALARVLRHLSDSQEKQEPLTGIPGLVWRENGSVKSNPIEFTEITRYKSPAWDLLSPSDYQPPKGQSTPSPGYSAPFITSRGCPGKCSFCCVRSISGATVRRRPLNDIIEELSLLYHEYQVRFLMMTDNGFLTDEEFVREMCATMIEKELKFAWDCVLIDTGKPLQDKTVKLMRQAGCDMVHIGVEMVSARLRKLNHKLNSAALIKELVDLFQKNGIGIFGYFMLGFPTETLVEMQETILFPKELNFSKASYTLCYPLPGTEVYKYILDKYRIKKIDWASFDIHSSPYPCSELSSKELTKLWRKVTPDFRIRMKPFFFRHKESVASIKRILGKNR